MNIGTALIPYVAAGVGTVASRIVGATAGNLPFARVLQSTSAGEVDAAPASSKALLGEPPTAGPGGAVGLSASNTELDKVRDILHRTLLRRFAESGIDVSEPIVLMADTEGRILEAGAHWDRDKIEQLLDDDGDLRNQVAQLLRRAETLRHPEDTGIPGALQNSIRLVIDGTQSFFTTR